MKMLKKLCAVFTLVCFLFTLMPTAIFANETKTASDVVTMQIGSNIVYKNSNEMYSDVAPVIVDGRTLVPVRIIVEALGGEVDWNEDSRTVGITMNGNRMELVIDQPIPGFGTGAIIMDGRTMVPVRYIMECVGAEVVYKEDTREVIIRGTEKATEIVEEKASEYTVTFDMNYGSKGIYKTVTVENGETVDKPENPSISGRKFLGWYDNVECKGDKYDFGTPVQDDLTLYGKWKKKSSNKSNSGSIDIPVAPEETPDISVKGENVSQDVTVDADNKVTADVTMQGENANASVSAGTKLKEGTSKLTLSISEVKDSQSAANVQGDLSLDVHLEGIAADNTVPVIINLGKVLPIGQNFGNPKVYHVENGETNAMTQVATLEELDAHNEFYYDPVDGTVVIAMASFSEVVLAADEENAWDGTVDDGFAGGSGTAADPYIIANADQFVYFAKTVGGMIEGVDQNSYTDAYVKLIADVNLGDKENENTALIFHPVGYYYTDDENGDGTTGDYYSTVNSFEGTFDGNGHTISSFYQNTWEIKGDYDGNYYKDGMGLFGYVLNGTVKNLTVDNFSSDGEFTPTGVIAAFADGDSTFENIAITNCNPRVYNTGNGGIIGIAGSTSAANDDHITLKNITVDNSNKISALWGSWDVACGGLVGMYRGNVDGDGIATDDTISFENCHVAAQIDVYNDVCANYQYYAYRYAGMMIGSIRYNTTNDDGKTIPDMTGISATGCTVNYGDWNDYYYCEFEKNSMASYSEDYQFSRVDKSEITFDEDGNVTGCTHDHTDAEDKRAVYLPFHQLFTGYSWGVNSIGLKEYSGIVTDLGITEGDQEESVEKFATKFTGDFLYRVGNLNAVALGSLFEAVDGAAINDSGVYVTVEPVDDDIDIDVSGTFTANTTDWTQGKIQFEGTGPVKVTIQDYDYCKPTELYLEVVDAYNRTTASFGGNSVLLNDVSTSSTLSTSGVIYGNGFTVNMKDAPISEGNGAVFHLYDGAVLKNLSIVGKEFTSVAMKIQNTDYGVSAVRAWGTVTIENCYISGCRSAIYANGTELTIKDSVIANGIYANIDFASGIMNLHNVTTINEPHVVDETTVLGLGIVGNMTASAGRQINITGDLTQYNWVSQDDCSNIKASGVNSIFESVFTGDTYAGLRYTYNGTTYVNTGILSLCSDFGESAVGAPSNYIGKDVTATISDVTVNGYVWAPGQAGALTDTDMQYHDEVYEWTASEQGTSYISSAFDFDEAGLEEEDGVVQITYESGSSYTLSNDTLKTLLNAEKYGETLEYTIEMNGVDYTDKDIVFDATASQTYTIVYTITDNLVYDKDGELTDTTYEVTKELNVFATVVDKGAEEPIFTFYYGTNGSASGETPHTEQPTNSYTSTIKQIGETYYIMPNVNDTSANAIGSKTIDNTTVYYPIVDGINVRSGNSADYDFTRYYPVFKAVTISDNGTKYSYNGTTEMPATVAWVSAEIDSGNGASALNDGFGLYNNQYLCKIQKKAGNAETGGTSVVEYSYTAVDGNTYNYYVGYRFYDEDEGSVCITPDTLITLADGSQKRVDQLTGDEQLLVWNMEEGKYDVAPIMFVFSGSEEEFNVLHLNFSDGSEVKVINEHGFFDLDLGKYVYTRADNYTDFIGHSFVKQGNIDQNTWEVVTLEDAYIETELTEVWSPVSAEHLNFYTNGVLSMPGAIEGIVNTFEVDTDIMAYDAEKMAQDIEKYGLFTYEDFNGLISEEAYEMLNAETFKVAIGKGMITWEEIEYLAERYLPLM